MAKEINNKTKWISLGFTVLVLFAGLITSFVWAQADIKAVGVKVDDVDHDMDTIKTEGCLPARATDKEITVLKVEVVGINKRLETMESAQVKRFDAIMKKLDD